MTEREMVQRYCVICSMTYLSHERYVSGWGAGRRDVVKIAAEDYSGRFEVSVEWDKIIRAIAADDF